MDVQEAVTLAKAWVRDLYADEDIYNLGLEEVKMDYDDHAWRVTIGFSRPWDKMNSFVAGLAPPNRSFKIVHIDDEAGKVVAMESREIAKAK